MIWHAVVLALDTRWSDLLIQYAGRVVNLTIVTAEPEHSKFILLAKALRIMKTKVRLVKQPGTGIGAALDAAAPVVEECGGDVFVIEDDVVLPEDWTGELGIYYRLSIAPDMESDFGAFQDGCMMGLTQNQYKAVTAIRSSEEPTADRRIAKELGLKHIHQTALHLTAADIGSHFSDFYDTLGGNHFWSKG